MNRRLKAPTSKKVSSTNSISWILVNSLGKLRFSRVSYYFIVIIPILAKALDKVSSPIFLKIGDNEFSINIDLPFSWYLFYFGAVLIAIGSLLYQIFCPRIIKDYKNYGEFLAAGESDSYLEKVSDEYNLSPFFLSFIAAPYLEEKSIEKVKVAPRSRHDEPSYKEYETVVDYKHNIKYQEERKNAFNKLYNEVKYSYKTIIYICFSLYTFGFIAFAWVIMQNISFVISHLLLSQQ